MAESIYHPLESSLKQIRLLAIEPLLDRQGRVNGRLSTASLLDDDRPSYKAMSWYWGDATRRKEIMLDGVICSVPANAVEVLEKACLGREYLHVWLDAVCINQEDLDERGHQVSFMEDIYAGAEQVVVWLGNDELHITNRALSSLAMLKKQFLEYTDEKLELQHETDDDLQLDIRSGVFSADGSPLPVFSTLPLPDCDWRAIEHFFNVPWFQRLWVCQEVMLNHNVTAVRGAVECPWLDIALPAKWMDHRRYWRSEYLGKRMKNIDATSTIYTFTNILDPDWGNLLRFGQHRRAALSVDYVYGLLGLVPKSSASHIARTEKDLIPNYSLPLARVFAAAVRVSIKSGIEWTNSLNVLFLAQTLVEPSAPVPFSGVETEDASEWPSWVPRYDWVWDPERGSPPPFTDWHGDNAAGYYSQTQMAEYSESPLVLGLEGLVVSTVVATSKVLNHATFNDNNTLCQEIFRWAARATKVGLSEEVFAMTLTSRKNHLEEDAADDPDFHARYEMFLSECQPASAPSTWSATSQLFLDALWRGSANKVIFELEDGRIGMGYPRTQAGDKVCIFFSGMAPFILRPHGEFYKLIGHAYVHDIMHVSILLLLQIFACFDLTFEQGEYIDKWQEKESYWEDEQEFQIV